MPRTDQRRHARAVLLSALALLGACGDGERPGGVAREAAYVGGARCAACHPDEARAWQGSHHDLAMAEADEASVLGAFDGRRVEIGGVAATFTRDGATFLVRSEERGGATADLRVTHAFGADPLQQYLVPLPGGRLQALPWAWDARPAADGGQRWFHLYADDPPAERDALHWASRAQTWNTACAACHSTNLRPGYDAASDTYATTWIDIDVSCEACHGPGARHVAWADGESGGDAGAGLPVELRNDAAWIMDDATGIARRDGPQGARAEAETCARCHALRAPIAREDLPGRPLLDAFRVELLEEGLYHADGQVRDEVYVYGSFLQSRMHAAGVTCSDCHDPHSLALPAPSPDAACARCHAPSRFAVGAHHGHDDAGPGASCVACHMPATTFMTVDARRDHSFRIPRPDLTVAIGTPNACSACHADRGAAWAAEAIERRHGPGRPPHYGEALHAGRAWSMDARERLLALAGDRGAPGIVRGTALSLLARYAVADDAEALRAASADPDPYVRLGAALGASGLEEGERVRIAAFLAGDRLLAVRLEAIRGLVSSASPGGPPPGSAIASSGGRARIDAAWADYRASLDLGLDRGAAWIARGGLAAAESRLDAAERAYAEALEREPRSVEARVNLADVLRGRGREDEAIAQLREAVSIEPGNAVAHYALGLALVRANRDDEALAELDRAARLGERDPGLAYAHAIALHSFGREEQALAALEDAAKRMPAARILRGLLAEYLRSAGRPAEALEHARALVALDPANRRAQALVEQLSAAPPGRP